MSRQRSVAAAAAVLVSGAALVVVGSEHPQLSAATARVEEQPITAASLRCPGSGTASTPTSSVLAVGLGGVTPVPGPAHLQILGTRPGTPRLGASPGPRRPVRIGLTNVASGAGVLVTADGAQAPGLAAAQLSTYHSTRANGAAASWCESPRDQWWFTGVDTRVGTSTFLLLSNPSPTVAVVDLHVLGADGTVDAAGATGIPVGPNSRLVLDLARYAPGQRALSLQVTATRGTVGAAVSTTRVDGLTPVGADWVPPAAAPATTVVVDAGVGGVGRQWLVVTNPTARQQQVAVRILDKSGAFTSTLLPDLQVPPETVVVKDVSGILKGTSTAIELSAAGPVTGAQVSQQAGRPQDFSVSGVSERLTGPAVVPVVDATSVRLSLASSSPGVHEVQVKAVTTLGGVANRQTVTVNGLATTTVKPVTSGAAYLVVTVPPGSKLHAVASYIGDAGITQLPLRSSPRTLLRPAVLPF
jgi:hypothetical protein